MNLNLLTETITNGYYIHYIFIISLISILLGISIIVVKNPVFSVLFLIGLFVTVSIYLDLLGLTFMGVSYLLVYVGAVSILFLFVLMLINVRTSELVTDSSNSIPLAIITVLYLNYSVDFIVPYCVYVFSLMFDYITYLIDYLFTHIQFFDTYKETTYSVNSLNKLGNIEFLSWDYHIVSNSHIATVGNVFYGDLFVLIIVISFILLLSMIGAIVVTVKRT